MHGPDSLTVLIFRPQNFTIPSTFPAFRFEGGAHFKNTEFRETATFIHAAFPDYLMIENATFSRDFRFMAVTISRFASISGSVFSTHAMFSQSSFEVPLHIIDTEFRKGANFMGVHGKGLFLRDVSFARLPSFVGADFEAAPEFDIVELDPGRLNKLGPKPPDSDYPAGWRALLRILRESCHPFYAKVATCSS